MSTVMKFTMVVAVVLVGMILFTSDEAVAGDRRIVIGDDDREIVLLDKLDRDFLPIVRERRVIVRPFINPFIDLDDLFLEEEDIFFFDDDRRFVRERERDERRDD